jgi:hypothetical protein
LELGEQHLNKAKTAALAAVITQWRDTVDAVRTWYMENGWIFIAKAPQEVAALYQQ